MQTKTLFAFLIFSCFVSSSTSEETEISMDWNTEKIVVRGSVAPEDRADLYERRGFYEHQWTVQSEEPGAKGLKITFNKTKLITTWDTLMITGQECSYRFDDLTYNKADQSQLPPLGIEGSWVTVHLKLRFLEYFRDEYEDLLLTVELLQETNNTDCSVCQFANPGDYCDAELCKCTAPFSHCDRHLCKCGVGSIYEDGRCVPEYFCDNNNRCVSSHGSFREKGTAKNWNESQAMCERAGARLVEITDDEFNEFVAEQDAFIAFFIGLSKNSTNGGYENWMENYPRNGCPAFFTPTKQWMTLPCWEENIFMCEKLPE